MVDHAVLVSIWKIPMSHKTGIQIPTYRTRELQKFTSELETDTVLEKFKDTLQQSAVL